jgi:hypothetical protein
MNGERANASHGYVDKQIDKQEVTLREYFERVIRDLSSNLDARFAGQEKAITTANAANEKRLDTMNEFRSSLSDQSKMFVTGAMFDSYKASSKTEIDRLLSDIESLKITRATLDGKASQSQLTIAMALSLIGLLTSIISIAIRLAGK